MFKINRTVFYSAALAVALLLPASSHASEYVKVSDANGKAVYFEVAQKPVVSFSSSQVIITAGTQTVEYPLTDYRKLEFTDQNAAAISKITEGQNPVFSIGETFRASNLTPHSRVAVYSGNGMLLTSASVDVNGQVSIDLSSCKGLLIIKTSTKSFKIIK